ncbi:MAG: hypothetical protein HYY33_03845, partial [Chloroflexi bacterium]|nr:hypothetical protein [Chloroflexota bacterium]
MSEVINAIYEGNGLVRLEKEPQGVKPHERLAILIVPIRVSKELSPEKAGASSLRQQLQGFEERYSLETPEFYARFIKGEMGDSRDFIVWAGLHELLQR